MYWSDTDAVRRTELEYLESALPVQDRIMLTDARLMGLIDIKHAVCRMMPWSKRVPLDIFLPYVLFPRVNNEDLTLCDEALWPALLPRVRREMDMKSAVLAVNRWCFEQATYQSTDDRTANALTVMRRGFGRCGEETVLLVTALRACGIPARQVYVPLWSHCDDNHAWVEAWADGEWHYLGACEPELSLDSGWFTAAASKAMLVHTRAYGVLPEGERTENHIGSAYIVNRTAAYARTRLLTVRVTEGGAPKPGVRVDFEVANMAAYRPICQKVTDAAGCADLLTGLGTLHIWATDGARSMECAADVSERDAVELDFAEAADFESGTFGYEQRPPLESKIQPADFPADEVAAHERRLAEAERARQARFQLPEGADPLVRAARGNREVIERFLSDARFEAEDKRALLGSLREKDLADVTEKVLTDALFRALPCKGRYPREIWTESVLCPRVRNEMLRPVRQWIRKKLPRFGDAGEVWRYLRSHMEPCEMDPVTLMPSLRSALEYGSCSEAVLDVLFVAVCRANGLAARLDPVTGEKMVWSDGAYRALLPGREPDARLVLKNASGRALTSGAHFSVSVLEDGAYRPLALHGDVLEAEIVLPVRAGRYRVMTASRQIDGSLEGQVQFVEVGPGERREAALALPEDRTADKLLRAELPPLTARDGDARAELPAGLLGRPGIIAFIAPGQEPTEHFLNELLEAEGALRSRGIAVRLAVRDAVQARNEKLQKVLRALSDARWLAEPDAAALIRWRGIMNAGELRLPLAVAVGRSGKGLFAFVNYNVGSVMTLIRIIDSE